MKLKDQIEALQQQVKRLEIEKQSLTKMLEVVLMSTENDNGLHETINAMLAVTNATKQPITINFNGNYSIIGKMNYEKTQFVGNLNMRIVSFTFWVLSKCTE